LTTTSTAANQTVATFTAAPGTGAEFVVKGYDTIAGNTTVTSALVALGSAGNVQYTIYGTVNAGGSAGTLNVAYVGGTIALQVTPASGASTVWTTQYRKI
jgi:hypothetical protein